MVNWLSLHLYLKVFSEIRQSNFFAPSKIYCCFQCHFRAFCPIIPSYEVRNVRNTASTDYKYVRFIGSKGRIKEIESNKTYTSFGESNIISIGLPSDPLSVCLPVKILLKESSTCFLGCICECVGIKYTPGYCDHSSCAISSASHIGWKCGHIEHKRLGHSLKKFHGFLNPTKYVEQLLSGAVSSRVTKLALAFFCSFTFYYFSTSFTLFPALFCLS